MEQFDNFKKNAYIILGVISSFIMPFLIDNLKNIMNKDSNWPTIFGVGIISLVLIIASFSLEKIIDNSSTLRKLISPTTFIEGFWYDITYDQGKFMHAVILQIEYDHGKYRITGQSFNDKKQICIFSSMNSVNFVNGDLLFHVDFKSSTVKEVKALDHLKFETPPKNCIPTSYVGSYIDYSINGLKPPVEIDGQRINDEDVRRFHNFKETRHKFEFIRKVILGSDSNIPDLDKGVLISG